MYLPINTQLSKSLLHEGYKCFDSITLADILITNRNSGRSADWKCLPYITCPEWLVYQISPQSAEPRRQILTNCRRFGHVSLSLRYTCRPRHDQCTPRSVTCVWTRPPSTWVTVFWWELLPDKFTASTHDNRATSLPAPCLVNWSVHLTNWLIG